MNILFLLFLYFIMNLTGSGKDKGLLSNLNLDKFSPLINLFTGGNFDLVSLLKSDLLKNINFMGLNSEKLIPIVELFNNFKSNDLFKAFLNNKNSTPEQEKKSELNSDFPLSAVSDIADKNITYSLSDYLSRSQK